MRLLFTTFLALVSLVLFSQSPEKINYQSIVRDLAGNVIQNQPISLRMSILSDSINGTIVYQETFQPTTNNFGLVNIKIGEGTPVIATMSSVDWSNGPFFLESAVDVTGGTNFIVVSTSQFMSVPYALYASESPLDTTQVQNIVNQQTNNFLDSTSIQNMIDSSVLNIDSTLIASWGYIDSNSIMILINNNSLDSTTIQNMIDNSIVNIDSSTVASWGYLDSSTIQILINNSTIDSSSVSNWGYLDSTTIQNIITQQTNNYLDSTSIQNMIDNSVTNIDSSTVASWGYVDSSSIMILINNNSLDSAAIQNMINSSITNVDSSTVASWGYLDSSSIIALISNSNIDSSSVANWGYLDSVSIQNMINNSSVNVDSTMIANFGFVAGPHTIDNDTQIDSAGIAALGYVAGNTDTQIDSAGIAGYGYLDSVSIRNMIDSMVVQSVSSSSGPSLSFPEGITGTPFSIYLTSNLSYTVPIGKNLYILNTFNSGNGYLLTTITGSQEYILGTSDLERTFDSPIIISEGETISPSSGTAFTINGLLVDKNPSITIENFYLYGTSSSYTVPIGKNLYILNTFNSGNGYLLTTITGSQEYILGTADGERNFDSPIIISEGETISPSSGTAFTINGYLADNNYFSSSSNSGSGSGSTIDSTTISNMGFVDSMTVVNMINSDGSGNNSFLYPDGYEGEPLYHSFLDSLSYAVPNGKSLYILGRFSDFPSNISINGITVDNNPNVDLHNPFILNGGDVITSGYTGPVDYGFYGFLVTQNIIAITESLSQFNSISYTVPTGKKLYILNFNSGNSDIKVNGSKIFNTSYSYPLTSPIIVDEGDVVSGTFKFNGYLADINYFNSSNSGSGSNSTIDSTTVANWGFSTDIDTQIDSAGIANLGYVAGPHTIDTDTDTQIDSAGIAAMGYLDSVSIRNMIDSAVASNTLGSTSVSTKTIHWPEGYHGEVMAINFDATNNSYIVPSGKNLYLTSNTPITTNFQQPWEDSSRFLINNVNYNCGLGNYARLVINSNTPIIAGSNDTVKTEHIQSMTIFGLLIDSMVEIINHNFMEDGNFTVPSGKNLFFNLNAILTIQGIAINGKQINQLSYTASQIPPKYSIAKEGDIITHSGNPPNNYPSGCIKMNGYLVDEDYFKTDSGTSSGSGSGSSSGSGSNANTLIYTTNGF